MTSAVNVTECGCTGTIVEAMSALPSTVMINHRAALKCYSHMPTASPTSLLVTQVETLSGNLRDGNFYHQDWSEHLFSPTRGRPCISYALAPTALRNRSSSPPCAWRSRSSVYLAGRDILRVNTNIYTCMSRLQLTR